MKRSRTITLRLTLEVGDDEGYEDAKDVVREWIAGSSNLPWGCKEMYIVGEHFNMDLPVDQNKVMIRGDKINSVSQDDSNG